MVDSAVYKVSRQIAERSGLLSGRYRTKDGDFILNNRDLSRVRFTTEEYINGLAGVEKITEEEAKILINENGEKMGDEE